MNKARRTSLKEATHLLDRAIYLITDARDEEQECLVNLPENLQNSDRCLSMESAVVASEDAIDKIDEAKVSIGEAIG